MSSRIERLADYIAFELTLTKERRDEILFGLRLLSSNLLNSVMLVIVGFAFGVLPQSLTVVMVSGTIKWFAGGAHASTPINCTITAVTLFTGLGWLAARIGPMVEPLLVGLFLLVITSILFCSVLSYAPADVPEKPITRPEKRAALRRGALVISFLWVGVQVAGFLTGIISNKMLLAMSFGLAWQALILTPVGYRLSGTADRLLSTLLGRGFPRRREV